MIEQRSTDFENNYLFTGHELDRETNLYYAHARYLNPRLGVWMSVDPLAENAPNKTPYHYCSNNPINLIDPDGMWETNGDGNLVAQKGDNAKTYADRTGKTNSEALTTLKSNGITVNEKGILSLKTGDVINDGTHHLDEVVIQGGSKKGGSSDFGTTNKNRSGFNIGNAINALNRNALNESSGKCARYVRWALEAGGINTNGHPISAKDYDTFLKKKGFDDINSSNYMPQNVDISVMESFNGTKRNHPHGHIQMYNGNQWISDFRQNGFWPGSDYRKHKPTFTILRK